MSSVADSLVVRDLRSEVLKTVKMIMFFYIVMLCGLISRYQYSKEHISIFSLEDVDCFFFSVGMNLRVYAVTQPRKTSLIMLHIKPFSRDFGYIKKQKRFNRDQAQ